MGLITKLTAISTAIGQKTGEPGREYTLDEMPVAISQIQTEFPEVEDPTPKVVNFYDYDGTKIANFSYEELEELTQLPELPTHPEKGLVATGWTSTLAEVKSVEAPNRLDVGAVYAPTGDATVLVIRPEKDVALTMTFSQSVSNGVTVDWGDGSVAETVAGTGVVNVTHTYTGNTAETEITITPSNGCDLVLGFNDTGNKSMFGATSESNNPQIVRAYIGKASIGNYAFYYMSGMAEMTISSSVTAIGNNAFQSCYGLDSIVIPNSVISIGSYAFQNCYALASVVIPNSVTNIGTYAFQSCYGLDSIVIPNSVTTIGNSAFNGCHGLNSVAIPNSMTTIVNSMFQGCYGLSSVVIPNSVTTVESYAFQNCFGLSSIVIPNSVTSFGNTAIQYCRKLTDVKFEARTSIQIQSWLPSDNRVKAIDFTACEQVPTISDANFLYNLKPYTNIIVPDDLYEDWIVAAKWSTKASQIVKASDYQ